MGIGPAIGEINYSVTSSTFERQPNGSVRVAVNLEGTATGYGTVTGTLNFISPTPGATVGPLNWTGAAFQPSGEVIGATAEGFWRKVDGKQQWKVYGINLTSTGTVLLAEATLDLASRSYQGTLAEWS